MCSFLDISVKLQNFTKVNCVACAMGIESQGVVVLMDVCVYLRGFHG